jgi:glycosyltransferase involved in cell wall biosynthesis
VLEIASRASGVHTIAAAADGPLLSAASSRGLATLRVPFAGKYSFAASLPLLEHWFRRADLVHLHGQFAGFYGALAARLCGTPAVYTAHFPSFITDSNRRNRVRNQVAEWLPSKISTYVVACSEASREEYISRGLVEPERIATIYNGVLAEQPTCEPAAVRAELGLAADDLLIAAVGRFTDQKGFDILIAAMPLLLRSVPAARVVLVGDGEKRAELDRRTKELGVNTAIRFTGFRSDTVNFLHAADVVAVPSRFDVFPLVPLEAMMAGRPVVASDLPALREAIDQGTTGLLVPVSPESFAQALANLLRDASRRRDIGKKAGIVARERFSVDLMVRRYNALYDCIAEGKA